jgi:hypothetical protein
MISISTLGRTVYRGSQLLSSTANSRDSVRISDELGNIAVGCGWGFSVLGRLIIKSLEFVLERVGILWDSPISEMMLPTSTESRAVVYNQVLLLSL